MKVSLSSEQKTGHRGFTLMELLVVITIIMILAGISFPAAQGVLAKAKKTSAENMALQVRSGIAAYYTEYRRYPLPKGAASGGDVTVRTNDTLMDILLGADGNKYNPRRIAFFAGKKAKGARNGLIMNSNGGGRLVDPWQEEFYVMIDTDYNNRVTAPFNKGGSGSGSNEVPQNVIVWSTGEDGTASKESDYITTW